MQSPIDALDLSVVVPVYNESGNVSLVADEVRVALDRRLRYELIFVDDGSSDGTGDEIDAVAARDSRVRRVQHTSNRGQSAAVHSGVRSANSAVIAVMDGDGQNDPRDIPKLYGQLMTVPSLALVIGRRLKREDNWFRRISSRIANAVRSRLLADGVSDTGCGIKVFHREAFLALPAFNHMHRFLPALFQRNGGKVSTVDVNHRPRVHGRSKYGINNRLWVGIGDLIGVMWLQKRQL